MVELHLLVRRLRPLLSLVILVLAAWLLVQTLLLRSGWYYRWTERGSTVGAVHSALRMAGKQHHPDLFNVLVLGDSRVNEGLSFTVANAAVGTDINLVRASVAGSTPRVWYYLLRKIDPHCERFDAVALVASFDAMGDTLAGNLTDRRLDLAYLVPLVGLRDLHELPASFTDPELQHRARRSILLPLLSLREDIKQMFGDLDKRLASVRWHRQHGIATALSYSGRKDRLPELDFSGVGESPPPLDGVTESSRPYLASYLRRLLGNPGSERDWSAENHDYVQHWLGRIAQRCGDSTDRMLMLQLPRGPYHAQLGDPFEPSSAALQLMRDHGFELIEPRDLRDLESPEFYFDGLHLNAAGRLRYSESLGEAIGEALRGDVASLRAVRGD